MNGKKLIGIALFLLLSLEAIMLEVKYQVFSGGGFLQSNPLAGPGDYFNFILLILSSYIITYSLLSYLVFLILQKTSLTTQKPAFVAGSSFLLLYGITLMTRYKLHQYVADHVDQTVINAIAGNDIKNALVYVKDELFFFLLPIIIFLVIFRVVLKFVKTEKHSPISTNIIPGKWILASILIIALSSLFSTRAVHINSSRMIAYNTILSASHILSDWDFDGSSYFSNPADPAPFDSDIFWGAVDLPGNNIDENGLGGDLPAIMDKTIITEQQIIPERYEHLVLIVSESTRSDILSQKVDGEYVAPNLRKLAASGSVIDNAFSHAGFTSNSLYTLFSGRYTYKPDEASLFKTAKANNFEVSIISGQDENWGDLDQRLATRSSADFFYDPQEDPEKRVFPSKLPSSIKLSDATLVDTFKKRLKSIDGNKRQLFYFNLQAAHFPYFHKAMDKRFIKDAIPRGDINKDNKEWLQRTYWNALSYMDSNLGKIIAELKIKGIYDKTLIMFIGDHGESLFHDGFLGHGHGINRHQLQIPLVLSAPNIKFSHPIGIIDIASWMNNYTQSSPHIFNKRGNCTFMYTGYLHMPAQIGQLCNKQSDIEVYTIAFDDYQNPNTHQNTENSKEALIHTWERILYQQYK